MTPETCVNILKQKFDDDSFVDRLGEFSERDCSGAERRVLKRKGATRRRVHGSGAI